MPIPQVPSPLAVILATDTYDSNWFPGLTLEDQIQSAIDHALADGASRVLVHGPFNSTLIAFNSTIQIVREQSNRISVDRGDNSVTLNYANADDEIQRFATTLTANRTITLSPAFRGARFRIVRTGLGSFTLDVGGLKTIPSATAAFVDVAHNGATWLLLGYGTL